MALMWAGILSTRSPMATRLVVTILPHRWRRERRTTRQLLEVLAWSFQAMMMGTFPMSDHTGTPWDPSDPRSLTAGRPLAAGLLATVVDIKGDWSWQCKLFGIPSWSCSHMCHECAAGTRPPYYFSDVRTRPGWRLRRIGHATLLRLPKMAVCPLAQSPGFHTQMLRKCSMHCCNLGFGGGVNGNCLVELVEEGFFGDVGLPAETLYHQAWADFKRFCAENEIRCSQPPFTPRMAGMIHAGSSPDLDTKAFNGRVISAYMAEVTQAALLANNSRHAVLRAGAAWGLAALYHRLERAPMIMTEEQADAAFSAGMTSLQCYNALACESVRNRRPRWTVRPKNHKVHHLLLEMKRSRPAPQSKFHQVFCPKH